MAPSRSRTPQTKNVDPPRTTPAYLASPRPIVAVYIWLMTAVWALTGTRFEGETRRERARRSVEAAFGNPPDVELRTPIVQG